MSEGNEQVVLCERGIRTFETATRNTLDLSAVPVLRQKTHLPVIVDPSHATGVRAYVEPLAKAAVACGADGLMIEVHPCPERALSDGPQSLTFDAFEQLTAKLKPYEMCIRDRSREAYPPPTARRRKSSRSAPEHPPSCRSPPQGAFASCRRPRSSPQ